MISADTTSNRIARRALDWVIAINDPACGSDTFFRLDAWLAEDAEHGRVFWETEAAWRAAMLRMNQRASGRAPEVGQETYVTLLKRSHASRVMPDPSRAYFQRIARNVALDWSKKQKDTLPIVPVQNVENVVSLSDPVLEACDEASFLGFLTAQLDGRSRKTFLLRNEGYSYREIALQLQISVSTVKRDLARAISSFSQALHATGKELK